MRGRTLTHERNSVTEPREERRPGCPASSPAIRRIYAPLARSGNDLHYRGYDILDVADVCEFEEIAYLIVHGELPTKAQLRNYKAKLISLRGLPAAVKAALEALPAASHPMDVMRTGLSAMGCVLPEKEDQNVLARSTSSTG